MAYRDKPDLYGTPLSPTERKQQRYTLWLLALTVLGTNSVSIARALGFHATHQIALYGVIFMGVICIAGAMISFRSARAEAARHIDELTHPNGR